MSVAIRVKPDTRDQLKAMKQGGETYDDVIQRVIRSWAAAEANLDRMAHTRIVPKEDTES